MLLRLPSVNRWCCVWILMWHLAEWLELDARLYRLESLISLRHSWSLVSFEWLKVHRRRLVKRHVIVFSLLFLNLFRKEQRVEVELFKLVSDQLLLLNGLHHLGLSDKGLRQVHGWELTSFRAKGGLGLPEDFAILLASLISVSRVIKCFLRLFGFVLLVLQVVKALLVELNTDRG